MKKNYEIQTIQPKNYREVATTYARVFAGEPWREVSRCSACGEFSGKNPAENALCQCGGTFSQEAYPEAETTQYVGQEVTKPAAVGLFLAQVSLLAEATTSAYGFGWGFQMTPQELATKKYRTEEMQKVISEVLVNSGFFYYVSEVGVLPELQGVGFGKKLTAQVVSTAQSKGYKDFVVRTNEDSAMRYILEKMGMRPVVGLKTGIRDTENPARVLFVGK